jgi:hypothetical protein
LWYLVYVNMNFMRLFFLLYWSIFEVVWVQKKCFQHCILAHPVNTLCIVAKFSAPGEAAHDYKIKTRAANQNLQRM